MFVPLFSKENFWREAENTFLIICWILKKGITLDGIFDVDLSDCSADSDGSEEGFLNVQSVRQW